MKRTWRNGRVKWDVFRKSSLNSILGQDYCLKSDFPGSNSSKAVLLQIFLDWSFFSIFNNSLGWHFSSCDYSISRKDPGTLRHLKQVFWDKSERFLVYHLLLSQRYLFSIWQGSWIHFCTVTGLFWSISRVTGCCLLKKINKHARLLYQWIFENDFGKARETSETGLFCESSGIAEPSLKWNLIQTLSWKSAKGTGCSFKN